MSYLELNPSVVESGNYEGGGALRGHGRGSLRALLIQASKRLLKLRQPAAKVGPERGSAPRGEQSLLALDQPPLFPSAPSAPSAVAVARKLTVAVWHVLMRHWNKALEETRTLLTKLSKLATDLGLPTLKELGYPSKLAFQEQKLEVLRRHP